MKSIASFRQCLKNDIKAPLYLSSAISYLKSLEGSYFTFEDLQFSYFVSVMVSPSSQLLNISIMYSRSAFYEICGFQYVCYSLLSINSQYCLNYREHYFKAQNTYFFCSYQLIDIFNFYKPVKNHQICSFILNFLIYIRQVQTTMKILSCLLFMILIVQSFTQTSPPIFNYCIPGYIITKDGICVSTSSASSSILSNSNGIFTVYQNPCNVVDSNGVCISTGNTNSQSGSTTTKNDGTGSAGILAVTGSSPTNANFQTTATNTQPSTKSQNSPSVTTFLPFLVSQPTSTSTNTQSKSTTGTNTASGTLPIIISTLPNPTVTTSSAQTISTTSTQTTPLVVQNPTSQTSNNQKTPLIVQNPTSQTSNTQTSSIVIPSLGSLGQQFVQILFNGQNINTLSNSATSSTTSSSSTASNQASQTSSTSTASTNSVNTATNIGTQSSIIPYTVTATSDSSTVSPTFTAAFWSDSTPTDDFCSKYNPTTQQCIQCAIGSRVNLNYNKNDPSNSNYCIALDPLCKTYTIDSSSCLICYVGYNLLLGKCVASASSNDINCKTLDLNNVCSQCYPGYYSNLILKICVVSNPQCKTFKSLFSDECSSCFGGYFPFNGDCIQIYSTTPPAMSNNGNNPAQNNPAIFYTQGGVPVLVTSSGPTATGTSDKNCAKFVSGTCTQCNQRAYFKNGVCVQVSDLCNSYDKVTGACTSCYKGYRLASDSTCVSSQPDNLCKTIDNATGLCKECYLGYKLKSGSCK